jgi:hypothetical protein
MKKLHDIIFYICIAIAVLAPGFCYAQDYGLTEAATESGLTESAIGKTGDIPTMLGVLVSIALSLVGVYFFILILYAGFIWMTAAGSTERVGKAKSKLTSAVIGLVIVLSAYTITQFIFANILQVSTYAKCENTPDGIKADECPGNTVCSGKKCLEECLYVYKDYQGKCMDITAKAGCDGRIFSGMCTGNLNMKCCVPVVGVQQYEKDQASAGASKAVAVPIQEQNACEKAGAGNSCMDVATCEGVYNGKAFPGNTGCAKGEVCCRSCKTIGGTCIHDLEQVCNDSKNLKTGYCFGSFPANLYKCCIGGYKSAGDADAGGEINLF